MCEIITLQEPSIRRLVESKAMQAGCSYHAAMAGSLAAVSRYKREFIPFRAIQYGVAIACDLAEYAIV